MPSVRVCFWHSRHQTNFICEFWSRVCGAYMPTDAETVTSYCQLNLRRMSTELSARVIASPPPPPLLNPLPTSGHTWEALGRVLEESTSWFLSITLGPPSALPTSRARQGLTAWPSTETSLTWPLPMLHTQIQSTSWRTHQQQAGCQLAHQGCLLLLSTVLLQLPSTALGSPMSPLRTAQLQMRSQY